MRVDRFDFHLPEDLIALRPVSPRDAAKMLVVEPEAGTATDQTNLSRITHAIVQDLPEILAPGDVIVFNNTKVVPTQLHGIRRRDGNDVKISATLHTRQSSDQWLAFVKGAKKVRVGDQLIFNTKDGVSDPLPTNSLSCEVVSKDADGHLQLKFACGGAEFDARLAEIGSMPLPPYIAGKRKADVQDHEDYQTRYAKEAGAVAAPTAGLHFTDALLDRLKERGVILEFVTLHVGPGTFLPVKVDDTRDHVMHSEWGVVKAETAEVINRARAAGNRLICVGTTSLRLVESAAKEDGSLVAWEGNTNIFITPGYQFKAADVLMTNFHLPRSTLFMLVSAFCGLDVMQSAYIEAINNQYRFYSYGDASLLYRAP